MALSKHTQQEVIDAIRGSHGIKITIARKLKVHRNSVLNYLKRYAQAREVYEEETESMGDLAESVIIKAIKRDDVETAKWYCRMKLKERGYLERNEHTGAEGGPIVIKVVYEGEKTGV